MPTIRLTCPECDADVRLAKAVPAGKKVQCPECDTVFRPPSDANVDRRRAQRDDYDDAPPRRSSSRHQRPKSSNAAAILIPLVLVGVLVLGGGSVAAVYFLTGKKTGPAPAGGPVAINAGPKSSTKAGGAAPATGPVGLEVGNVAMEIEGEDIDGARFKLSDYRGKVVVLDFWGHW